MTKPLPTRPNVRNCTHIKVTGQQCGSPALRGEFFCYFHTRVIKGVPQRVDMRLDSMALLEDCESIQLSLMHVVDGLVKGTLEPVRARLIIQALRIAARVANEARFDACYYKDNEQKMVREVPNYASQYLIEHPEYGPPLDTKSADSGSATAASVQSPCAADTPVRQASTIAADHGAAVNPDISLPKKPPQNASPETASKEPAAERRQNEAHRASRGSKAEIGAAAGERKNPGNGPVAGESKEYELIRQAQAAIPGALEGNWRDLRTVFEFAGITGQGKEAPS